MTAGELRSPKTVKWESRHEDILGQIRKQAVNLEAVIDDADALHEKMTAPSRILLRRQLAQRPRRCSVD